MKYSKLKAIDYCHKCGLEFINLFNQLFNILNKAKQSEILNKMQTILDNVNNIFITKEKHFIFNLQKMCWFYSVGDSYYELFNSKEMQIKYDEFVLLTEANKNVQLSFTKANIKSNITSNNISFEKYNNILILDLLTTEASFKTGKIIKFGYALLNKNLDIVLNGEFYVKQRNLEISENFKIKNRININEIEFGQDENFVYDLLKRLVNPNTLLVSFNVYSVKKFLSSFLSNYNEQHLIQNLDTLDLLSVFKDNNKNKKNYSLKEAIKFYNIDCEYYKSNVMEYYLLLKEMIKFNNISLYVKQSSNNLI